MVGVRCGKMSESRLAAQGVGGQATDGGRSEVMERRPRTVAEKEENQQGMYAVG